MSEVVVRMEIPGSCDCCPCLDDYGDYPRCRISGEQRGYNFDVRNNRMPNCPILAVLPEKHGRLVDIDEEILNVKRIAGWSGVTNCWRGPIANLINKDTMKYIHILVPATEGGKE